jgi:acyl carrier protein
MDAITSLLKSIFVEELAVSREKLERSAKLKNLMQNKFDINIIKDRLEHHFGSSIPDKDAKKFVTFGDIEDYLLERKNEIIGL